MMLVVVWTEREAVLPVKIKSMSGQDPFIPAKVAHGGIKPVDAYFVRGLKRG